MKLEWIVGMFLIPCASLLAERTTAAASSKWWSVAIPPRDSNEITSTSSLDSVTDPSTVYRLKLLNKSQRKSVRNNPGSMYAIAAAVALAVNECRYQFELRRWNCTTTTTKTTGQTSLFGKILLKGFRETAFIHAITTAAVTHSVARACSEGSISTCSCDGRVQELSGDEDWVWGGCSDNVYFSRRFARKFVDAGENGKDSRSHMNIHNNEVGRRTVYAEMKKECKCHGMSGSCEIKTCWMRLPSFREVGTLLKDRFDGASKVVFSNNGSPSKRHRSPSDYFEPFNPSHKVPTSRDLIYFDDSPDFCERNPKYGSVGTRGRTCNDTSIGMDGCDLMCCNRGYISVEEDFRERCMCTFKWCCVVQCMECQYTRTVHKCL